MLERAWEMKVAIRKWLNLDVNKRRYAVLVMKDEEWGLVDDLLKILQPFSRITTAIGTTLDVQLVSIRYSSCITGFSNSLRQQKKPGKLKHATLSMPMSCFGQLRLHTTNSLSIMVKLRAILALSTTLVQS